MLSVGWKIVFSFKRFFCDIETSRNSPASSRCRWWRTRILLLTRALDSATMSAFRFHVRWCLWSDDSCRDRLRRRVHTETVVCEFLRELIGWQAEGGISKPRRVDVRHPAEFLDLISTCCIGGDLGLQGDIEGLWEKSSTGIRRDLTKRIQCVWKLAEIWNNRQAERDERQLGKTLSQTRLLLCVCLWIN